MNNNAFNTKKQKIYYTCYAIADKTRQWCQVVLAQSCFTSHNYCTSTVTDTLTTTTNGTYVSFKRMEGGGRHSAKIMHNLTKLKKYGRNQLKKHFFWLQAAIMFCPTCTYLTELMKQLRKGCVFISPHNVNSFLSSYMYIDHRG